VGWVHGDLAPNNVLLDPDGSRVTGVVDWEWGAPDGLPLVDIAQLLLFTRSARRKQQLGTVVERLLRAGEWEPDEAAILDDAAAGLPGPQLPLRMLVLLGWLGHVRGNLVKSTRYARSPFWLHANVDSVLQAVAGP
jgi:Ser/Thr protein kinase RdoA (MazF antagonist)